MPRIRIKEGERVPVKLRAEDRKLINNLGYVDPDYIDRLEPAADSSGLIGHFALEELDDLLGCVAAEANHTDNRRLERELDSLFGRLKKTMERYDDGLWQDTAL